MLSLGPAPRNYHTGTCALVKKNAAILPILWETNLSTASVLSMCPYSGSRACKQYSRRYWQDQYLATPSVGLNDGKKENCDINHFIFIEKSLADVWSETLHTVHRGTGSTAELSKDFRVRKYFPPQKKSTMCKNPSHYCPYWTLSELQPAWAPVFRALAHELSSWDNQ